MRIFISYSRKDFDLVTTLAEDIQALGYEVWFDRELARTGGQKWWDNVLLNVRQCDLFLFALSANSLASEPCQREYRYAYALNKRILPIMIGQVDTLTLPSELQELQWLNYRDRSRKQGLALAATLHDLPPQRPMPDPLPQPPEAPLSPMGRIAAALDKPSLSSSEQIELFFELDALFRDRATRSSAQSLLHKLHDREDTTRLVADKIRDLLRDSDRQEATARRSGSLRQLTLIAAIVIVIIGVSIFALNQFARSGGLTPTSHATVNPAATQTAQGQTQVAGAKTFIAVAIETATLTPTETPIIPQTAIADTLTARAVLTAIILASNTATQTLTPSMTPTFTNTPDYQKTIVAGVAATDAQGTANVIASYTKTFTPTPTPTIVPTITANRQWTPLIQPFDGVDMVLVPPGCFLMGSADIANAQPVTRLCFDKPFWLDKTDVTQAQFRRFGGQAAHSSGFIGDNRPVESINWFEASQYCSRQRGARLPTEAEWEYAARGPDDLIYPWGNTFDPNNAVYVNNSGKQTADVGSKPAGKSWVGALDMVGNVWQWTSSLYMAYPYKADDGRENATDTKNARVLRGGSWLLDPGLLRSAYRVLVPPGGEDNDGGLRCARSF